MPPSLSRIAALTAHEYLHLSMPRWRNVWAIVLDGYTRSASAPSSAAASSSDRTEDLMLALVAFLLQRLPADAALPADRRAALPVSFPPALVKCPRIASLGGTFRHGPAVSRMEGENHTNTTNYSGIFQS